MRSHPFRALPSVILLSGAFVLGACGESVNVGTFEDGSGAGGGLPATATDGPSGSTSSGNGGTTSTTSVSSSGAGGEDVTTTSTTSEGGGGSGGSGGSGGGSTVCGGLGGDGESTCADDELCDYPDDQCGAADGTGVCVPRPQACSFDLFDPACSCDGEVYQSPCFANLAGVDVSVLGGTCDGSGGPCGGKSGQTCNDDELCQFEGDSCGWNDEQGTCVPRPTTCQSDGPLACACDGQNYPSACEAAMHGNDVWGGEDFCPAPTVCGGLAQLECAPDELCDYPNDRCGGDDGTGVCRLRPTDCPIPGPNDAVCVCTFGDSYPSECEANKAGEDRTFGDGLECGGA